MESLRIEISYKIKELILGTVIVSCLLLLASSFLAQEKNSNSKMQTFVKTQKEISQQEALNRADEHLKTAETNQIIYKPKK